MSSYVTFELRVMFVKSIMNSNIHNTEAYRKKTKYEQNKHTF